MIYSGGKGHTFGGKLSLFGDKLPLWRALGELWTNPPKNWPRLDPPSLSGNVSILGTFGLPTQALPL